MGTDWGVIRDGCYAAVNAALRFIHMWCGHIAYGHIGFGHMGQKNVWLTTRDWRGNLERS